MDSVLIVDIYTVVDITENKDHALRVFRVSRDDRVEALRLLVQVVVCLDVFQKIHPKLIQAEIHDGDTGGHILNIYDFFTQAL